MLSQKVNIWSLQPRWHQFGFLSVHSDAAHGSCNSGGYYLALGSRKIQPRWHLNVCHCADLNTCTVVDGTARCIRTSTVGTLNEWTDRGARLYVYLKWDLRLKESRKGLTTSQSSISADRVELCTCDINWVMTRGIGQGCNKIEGEKDGTECTLATERECFVCIGPRWGTNSSIIVTCWLGAIDKQMVWNAKSLGLWSLGRSQWSHGIPINHIF